jgi:hypothetical protein
LIDDGDDVAIAAVVVDIFVVDRAAIDRRLLF